MRDTAIVACVLAVLLLVVGAAAYFALVVADRTLQQEDMANLSDQQVSSELTDLRLSTPDLSELAYVSNESLEGPRFEDISIGAIRYGQMKDGKLTPTTRQVEARAVWQSSAVVVERPLSAEFEFAGADAGWTLSVYTLSPMEAEPLRPLNMYELEDDVVPMLRLHDAALGEAFADAHVALSGDLSMEGGTVKAVLTKTIDDQARECIMNLNVSWSTTRGWLIDVASVTSQEGTTSAEAAAEGQAPITPELVADEGGQGKEWRLTCHEGDLVALTGTLTQRDGIFVLETSITHVTMQGRTWSLSRFVVTGPSARLNERLHSEVTVTGYLTAGYVLDDAPLSLAMTALS